MADTTFEFETERFDSEEAFGDAGYRCSMHVPSPLEITRVTRELAEMRAGRSERVSSLAVHVRFKHLMDGGLGRVTASRRTRQIQVLNDSFGGSVSFTYAEDEVEEIDNANWYRLGHGSAAERSCKRAHNDDPRKYLNFYTGALQGSLLGWARFPYQLAGDPELDGVVMRESTLPGGKSGPYSLGLTAAHEVGHWTGLWHSFQGGCSRKGDEVTDTPAHKSPDYGRPESGPSCDGGQNSPVHNIMNYTHDAHMTDPFTSGQVERIFDECQLYRPGIIVTGQTPPPEPEPDDSDEHVECDGHARGALKVHGEKTYVIRSLPGPTRVRLEGPEGSDFDVYAQADRAASKTDWAYKGDSKRSHEELTIRPKGDETWYLLVRSHRGSGKFQLCLDII